MEQITVHKLADLYTAAKDQTEELLARPATSYYYSRFPDAVLWGEFWRAKVTLQSSLLQEVTGVRVRYVEGQPFNSAEEMFEHIDAHRELPISTDFNESALNGPEANLHFRAAHDLSHFLCDKHHRATSGVRCNFEADGETRAAHWQTQHLLGLLTEDQYAHYDMTSTIIQIVFSEVILQAAHFYSRGDFAAEQKLVLTDMLTIKRWFWQYNLPLPRRTGPSIYSQH